MGEVRSLGKDDYRAQTVIFRRAIEQVRRNSDASVHPVLGAIEDVLLCSLSVVSKVKQLDALIDE